MKSASFSINKQRSRHRRSPRKHLVKTDVATRKICFDRIVSDDQLAAGDALKELYRRQAALGNGARPLLPDRRTDPELPDRVVALSPRGLQLRENSGVIQTERYPALPERLRPRGAGQSIRTKGNPLNRQRHGAEGQT